MKKAQIGASQVSVIGFGCMGMSQHYARADSAESERILY